MDTARRWAGLDRFSGISWVLAGQALQSLASFLAITVLGRWAGAGELGIFALGLSVYFLAVSSADTLIGTPYTYIYTHTAPSSQSALAVSGAMGAMLLGSLLAVLLTVLWWFNWTALASLWPALPCLALLTVGREFLRRHLLVEQRYRQLFFTDATLALGQVCGLAGLALGHRLSAFSATGVVAAAAGVSLWTGMRGHGPSAEAVKAGLERLFAFLTDAVRYGHWLFLGGLCHIGSVQLYPWLAMAGGGERQAGLYAGCIAIVNLANPLLLGLTNYFRPRFMQAMRRPGSAAALRAYVARRSVAFVLPTFLLAGAVSLFGQQVLSLLYGEHFKEAGAALVWMAWGAVAMSVAATPQLALLALHAPFTNFFYHSFNLAALVVAAWWSAGGLNVDRLGQLYGVINALGALLVVTLWWRQVGSSAVLQADGP